MIGVVLFIFSDLFHLDFFGNFCDSFPSAQEMLKVSELSGTVNNYCTVLCELQCWNTLYLNIDVAGFPLLVQLGF